MPPCLQDRVARGEPLPGVVLMPAAVGQTEEEDEEARKFHSMVALLLGTPPDAFKAVLGMLKPSWDPLRRRGHDGQHLQA